MRKDDLLEALKFNLSEFYHSKVTAHLMEVFQGEGAVLLCLQHNPGGINPSQISEMVSISRARVTNILNSLKQKELVSLELDEDDRRKTLASLTEKGSQSVIEGANKIELYMDSLLHEIGEEKIATLVDIVKTVNDTFKRWEREASEIDE